MRYETISFEEATRYGGGHLDPARYCLSWRLTDFPCINGTVIIRPILCRAKPGHDGDHTVRPGSDWVVTWPNEPLSEIRT